MKKFLCLSVTILLSLSTILFTGCNKQVVDFNYSYDVALVQFPDGTYKEIELSSWTDYEGEQLQLTDKDGTVYLVNSVNCVLIKK